MQESVRNASELNSLETWPIATGYTMALVDRYPDAEYHALFQEHMVPWHSILPWRSTLEPEQKEKLDGLQTRLKTRHQIRLALLHEGVLVGWTYGWQDSVHLGDYYLAGALVGPEHRRKGFYSIMLAKFLELTEKEGFAAVRSRHVCTNNAVLIGMLKAGFIINGFEQDDTIGTLVRTIYYHHDLRKKAANFRAGKIDEPGILDHLSMRRGF